MLRRVREEEPARPRRLCTDTPAALEAVCLRAMAKRREDRYPGAAELAREVEKMYCERCFLAMPVKLESGMSRLTH